MEGKKTPSLPIKGGMEKCLLFQKCLFTQKIEGEDT